MSAGECSVMDDILARDSLFRGYVATKNKRSIDKIKNQTDFRTYEQVKELPEFGGILNDNVILIDIDNTDQAEKFLNIVESEDINSVLIRTGRGIHAYFKNTDVLNNKTATFTAVGITADMKRGNNSYGILKLDGKERTILRNSETVDSLPKWLTPIKANIDFFSMGEGDGRNQELFNYILVLQSQGFTKEEIRETIRLINKYILKKPLSNSEIETILRNEAFQKPQFYKDKKFQHHIFGDYIKREEHVIKINTQLHIYYDGIYVDNRDLINRAMIRHIPAITKNQRCEALSYLDAVCEEAEMSDIQKIPVANGLLNIRNGCLEEFTPHYISKNKIPTLFNPNSYDDTLEEFMNDISCNNNALRLVIEEMIGSCLYRNNAFQTLFVLTGSGSNGKSTLLKLMSKMLGYENISSVELKDLEKTFKTAELFGKLANIGDDISSDMIRNSSLIKKLSSGERSNVEKKGRDPFEFSNYATLIYSCNTIPMINDTQFGLLRRLKFIPFNNKFAQNMSFEEEILKQERCEYLLKIAVDGLKRYLANKRFTFCKEIDTARNEYEKVNNPVLAFLDDVGKESLLWCSTDETFLRFDSWCIRNGYKYEFRQPKFVTEVKRATGYDTKAQKIPHGSRIGGKQQHRIFVESAAVQLNATNGATYS